MVDAHSFRLLRRENESLRLLAHQKPKKNAGGKASFSPGFFGFPRMQSIRPGAQRTPDQKHIVDFVPEHCRSAGTVL